MRSLGSQPQRMQDYPWRIEPLGSGDLAIYNTVGKMKQIIEASAFNPYVRKSAEQIIVGIDPGDKVGEVEAIYEWMKHHIRYTRDPMGMEYLQTPPHLLEIIGRNGMAFGDCDDMTMFVASLLKSIGFNVGVKVASYKPDGAYSHIYALVFLQGKWVALDGVKREFVVGYEVPNWTRAATWEI